MKKTIVAALVGLSFTAQAQWKEYNPEDYSIREKIDYPLRNYVNPEFHYREINAVFHMNGGLTDYVNNEVQERTYNSFSVGSNAALNGYSLHNTASRQQTATWYVQAGIGLSGNNSEQTGQKTDDDDFNRGSTISYSTGTRFYKGRRFYEIGGTGDVNFSASSSKYTATTDQHENSIENNTSQFAVSFDPRLLVGRGRIEQTSNAWRALQIVRALQRADRLAVVPEEEIITKLADQVTLLRNRRVFDGRLRAISDLIRLDSTLISLGLVSKSDIASYAAVNDIWSYGGAPDRPSGSRVYIGLAPGINWGSQYRKYNSKADSTQVQDVKTTTESNYQHYNIVAGLRCEKPVSTEWQRSFWVEATAGLLTNELTWATHAGFSPSADLTSSFSYGYFPNTRTTLTAGVSGNLSWLSMKYDVQSGGSDFNNQKYSNFSYSLKAVASVEYYLSPAVVIYFDAKAEYSDSQTNNDWLNTSISLFEGYSYQKEFYCNLYGTLVYKIR